MDQFQTRSQPVPKVFITQTHFDGIDDDFLNMSGATPKPLMKTSDRLETLMLGKKPDTPIL